jgi:hypothetical protein
MAAKAAGLAMLPTRRCAFASAEAKWIDFTRIVRREF